MIRILNEMEFTQAAELSLNVFMESGMDDFDAEGLDTFKSFVNSDERMQELTTYGAFEGDTLVGVLATKREGTHVSLFFIMPEYRGKGIGRKLFEFALRDKPVREMTVNSSSYAVKIYESLGFQKISEEQETNGLRYTPMIRMSITQPNLANYDELIELWETSVRSSHHFLTEDDILFYKQLVPQYFPAVELYIMRNEQGRIAAFMGLSDELIEMLFVHPQEQGKGLGKELMRFAIQEKHMRKVDVNEQNTPALQFYTNQRFRVIGRDELDSSGKPYPILHLHLLDTPDLETDRLLLRPFKQSDAPELYECCKNPNLGNNAGWEPHESLEETAEVLDAVFLGKEGIWAITSKEAGNVIGSIGLIPDPKRQNPHTRMLGYWLKEDHWGQGLMSEAVRAVLKYGFTNLELHLISANCYPHNLRSQRVLEKNRFQYEGQLRQAELMYDGRIYDHLCYFLEQPQL